MQIASAQVVALFEHPIAAAVCVGLKRHLYDCSGERRKDKWNMADVPAGGTSWVTPLADWPVRRCSLSASCSSGIVGFPLPRAAIKQAAQILNMRVQGTLGLPQGSNEVMVSQQLSGLLSMPLPSAVMASKAQIQTCVSHPPGQIQQGIMQL